MNNSITCVKESFVVGVDYHIPWLDQLQGLELEVNLYGVVAPEQMPAPPNSTEVTLRLAKLKYPVRGINQMNQLLLSIGGEAANLYELVAFIKTLRDSGKYLRPSSELSGINIQAVGTSIRSKGFIWVPSFIIDVDGGRHFSFHSLVRNWCPGGTYYLVREIGPMVPHTIFPYDQLYIEEILGFLFRRYPKCTVCSKVLPYEFTHCARCGSANPEFRPAIFYASYQESIEEYRVNECDVGHPGLRRDVEKHEEEREKLKQEPFCIFCGRKLDFV